LLGNGHILLEGVPDLQNACNQNTRRSYESKFQRIQFTPDLLPADLVGTQIYNQKDGNFFIRKGHSLKLILADE